MLLELSKLILKPNKIKEMKNNELPTEHTGSKCIKGEKEGGEKNTR